MNLDEDFATPTTSPAEDEPIAPAAFDFATWAAGVRPTRHSVMIYQRPDLLADLDEVAELELRATSDEERAEWLERGREIAAEMMEGRIRVTVEGRSAAWREALIKELDAQGVEDNVERLLHGLAAQIVEPAGVTPEALEAIADVSEPQVMKLLQAQTLANDSAPTISPRYLGKD